MEEGKKRGWEAGREESKRNGESKGLRKGGIKEEREEKLNVKGRKEKKAR